MPKKRLVRVLSEKEMSAQDRMIVYALIDDMRENESRIIQLKRDIFFTNQGIHDNKGHVVRSRLSAEVLADLHKDMRANGEKIGILVKENRLTESELLRFLRTGKFQMETGPKRKSTQHLPDQRSKQSQPTSYL